MSEDPQAQKIPLVFFSTSAGHEPVRDRLNLELARKRKKELER